MIFPQLLTRYINANFGAQLPATYASSKGVIYLFGPGDFCWGRTGLANVDIDLIDVLAHGSCLFSIVYPIKRGFGRDLGQIKAISKLYNQGPRPTVETFFPTLPTATSLSPHLDNPTPTPYLCTSKKNQSMANLTDTSVNGTLPLNKTLGLSQWN